MARRDRKIKSVRWIVEDVNKLMNKESSQNKDVNEQWENCRKIEKLFIFLSIMQQHS